MLRGLLLASLALSLVGCSSDGGGEGGRRDAGGDSGSSAPEGPGGWCTETAECADDFDGTACVGGHCGCLSGDDCREGLCDPATHGCVGCITSSDCSQDLPICIDRGCFECESSSDCADSAFGRVCEGRSCTCGSNADCPANSHCRNGRCEPLCDTDAACADNFYGRTCDETTGICVPCVVDADCVALGEGVTGFGPICLEGTRCGCVVDDDCVGNTGGSVCVVGACLP